MQREPVLPFCVMAKLTLALIAAASVPTCLLGVKVKVDIYFETGCPFCQKFLRKTLKPILHSLPKEVVVEGHPFGNAFYLDQQLCPQPANRIGWYLMETRKCWEAKCGAPAMGSAPATCYTGTLVCQHGETECKLNRAAICMKELTPDPLKYMDYAICLADRFQNAIASKTEAALPIGCAGNQSEALKKCLRSEPPHNGEHLVQQEASMTPVHAVVPYVTVDGQAIEAEHLRREVCDRLTGVTTTLCPAKPGPKPAPQLLRI